MRWSLLPQDNSLPHKQFHLKEKGTISVLFYMTLQSPLDRVLHIIVNFKNLKAWKYASTSPQICKMKKNQKNLEHGEKDLQALKESNMDYKRKTDKHSWVRTSYSNWNTRRKYTGSGRRVMLPRKNIGLLLWSVWWDQKS